MNRVIIFDTTLRDGEQTPGVALTVEQKVDLALKLADLGVDVIEAGFPVASPGEFQAVRRIAEAVRGPAVAALARTHPYDIEQAWEAIKPAPRPRIHVFVSTSDIHVERMLQTTRAEVLRMVEESVREARARCADVEFSAQDATRTEIPFLIEVVQAAVEAGAATINLPDTVGFSTPWSYAAMFETVMAAVPADRRVVFSAHTHDDLGLAVANSLAAVRAGARQVECTVNGIGERAGNCSLEELVMALRVRADEFGLETGVDTTVIGPVSEAVSRATRVVVPPNKAVVGANAFAHESGIHQDGVLKDPSTYEIMRPDQVGAGSTRLVLGKHSGRHAFRMRLEQLGLSLGEEAFARVFARFKELADRAETADDRIIVQVAREVLNEGEGAVRKTASGD